ncbi:MAG TPA: hypothetical protein VGH73_04380 [Thermoanaerobaculia bacterium]
MHDNLEVETMSTLQALLSVVMAAALFPGGVALGQPRVVEPAPKPCVEEPAHPEAQDAKQMPQKSEEALRDAVGPWDVQRPAGVARSTLEFRLVLDAPEPDSLQLPDPQGETLLLSSKTVVTQNDILKTAVVVASAVVDFGVYVYFTPEAAQRMQAVSRANVGHRIAIVMDGHVFMAPVMNSEIGSPALIEGRYTRAEAQRVAEWLAP